MPHLTNLFYRSMKLNGVIVLAMSFASFMIAGCGAGVNSFGTKLDSSDGTVRSCKPNELNSKECIVDKVGSYIYDSEYGGRTQVGRSFLGANGLSVLAIPLGWYDGQTKVTFTESNLTAANQSKIRLGKNILGIDGSMVTSLPDVCSAEQDDNCMISATTTSVFYAYTSQYGGRGNICALNAAGKLTTDCWIDSINTRMNTTTPINDVDCASSGAVAANCTARASTYWYTSLNGGRNDCSAGATSLQGCWLDIPSGSVTLSDSSVSTGASSNCVDARSVGFSAATSCRTNLTTSPTWYVYSSLFGGRGSECTADNAGSCYFKSAYDEVDPDLAPENIKYGVKIFDIMGSFEGDGVWSSAAHRESDITQITFSAEAVTYRDKPNLPGGYRSIPMIASDDEGAQSVTDNGVLRTNWNSTCGLTGTISDRISDCSTKFDINATWSGASKGNAGQGTWKLVTRAGNISNEGIYREVWRDERTGLLWSSVVSKTLNWCQAAGVHTTDTSGFCNNSSYQTQPAGMVKAISACYEGTSETSTDSRIDLLAKAKTSSNPLSVKWRIPTIYDYEVADYNGIRYVMPDMSAAGNVEWTGTTRATDLTKAWVFDSRTGATDIRTRTDATIVVRCVGEKGYQ